MDLTYPPFGHQMKEKIFLLSPGFNNLNFGSFGAPPREVLEAKRKYEDECEAEPDKWFRGQYQRYLKENRERLANYIGADQEDITFTESSSTAVNSILRSLSYEKSDKILHLSTAYPMVKHTLSYLVDRFNISLIEVPVVFPGKSQPPTGIHGSLVESIEREILANKGKIKIACFSHITSIPAIILPLEDILPICKKHGVSVLIDGAHTIGHIPLNLKHLESLGMDYWTANGHKWLYTPKGSALMWVTKSKQNQIIPTVISSAFTTGFIPEPSIYQTRFQYTATRDYTPFCTFKHALRFREKIGEEKINKYNHELATWAQNYLAKSWKTEVLVPDYMTGNMGNVRLPLSITSKEDTDWLQAKLWQQYRIMTAVYELENPVTREKSFWFRLSANIFNEKSDFLDFDKAVKELLSQREPSGRSKL